MRSALTLVLGRAISWAIGRHWVSKVIFLQPSSIRVHLHARSMMVTESALIPIPVARILMLVLVGKGGMDVVQKKVNLIGLLG